MRRALALPLLACVAACAGRPDTPVAVPVPATEQWLYGSAEGAISVQQSWDAVAAYVLSVAAQRPHMSVVLDEASGSIDNPPRLPCGAKPLAVVFDADETLIWNLGVTRYQSAQGKGFDEAVWAEWERTGAGAPTPAAPGVVDALASMRAAGITIVVNTNRAASTVDGTVAALKAAGLGDFVHGETLFLKGDTPPGRNGTTSDKDARRSTAAARYCVVAMAGDQLGDFSDRLNAKALSPAARKALAMQSPFRDLWGRGWFLIANPVYGPALRGGFDDVYPPETRWVPPTQEKAKP